MQNVVSDNLEACLVRICDHQLKTKGTGFVVSENLAITCAHVVRDCGVDVGQNLNIVFYKNNVHREAKVLSEYWRSPEEDDIAVLLILPEHEALPDEVVPAKLGWTSNCEDHQIKTIGFVGNECVRSKGEIYGIVAHSNKSPMLQIHAEPIHQGMSGSPILDLNTQCVVGMLNEKFYEIEFTTTSDTLKSICPILRLYWPEAIEDYLNAVKWFCNSLPCVSQYRDIPLEMVYVPQQIRFIDTSAKKPGESITEPRPNPISIIRALEKHQMLMLVGGPGLGKSSQIRYLVQQLAENQLTGDNHTQSYLPILVSLRNIAKRQGSIQKRLHEQIVNELDGRLSELPKNFLEDWIKYTQAKWLIAFDGLDNIVDVGLRRNLVDEISQTIWPKESRIIITTRNYEYGTLGKFAPFDLLPFGPEQVEKFAFKWFHSDNTKARAFLKNLQSVKLEELGHTPLILTIAAVVFQNNNGLPIHRFDLYNKFINILIGDAPETYNHEIHRQIYDQFSTELDKKSREMLEHIALAYQEGNSIYDALGEYLQKELMFTDRDINNDKLHAIMGSLVRLTGLIVRHGEYYEFLHPVIQRYLAAAALVRKFSGDIKKIRKYVLSHWNKDNWREITIFVLGILDYDGDRLVRYSNDLVENTRHSNLENFYFNANINTEVKENLKYSIWYVNNLIESIRRKRWKREEGLYFAADTLAEIEVEESLRNRIQNVNNLMTNIKQRDERLDFSINAIAKVKDSLNDREDLIKQIGLDLLTMARYWWRRHGLYYEPEQAVEALGRLGQVDHLLTLARERREMKSEFISMRAVEVLGEIGQEDHLFELASNDKVQVNVRKRVVEVLGKLNRIDDLLALAKNYKMQMEVRKRSAEMLIELKQENLTIPILLDLVNESRLISFDRLEIASTLSRLGQSEKIIPILLKIAFDKNANDYDRMKAVGILGELGLINEAVSVLLPLAQKGIDKRCRMQAIETLSKLNKVEEAISLLSMLVDEKTDHWYRVQATEMLAKLGQVEKAIAILLVLARDEKASEWECEITIEALGKLGRVNELMVLANDKEASKFVRNQAIKLLDRLKTKTISKNKKLNRFLRILASKVHWKGESKYGQY